MKISTMEKWLFALLGVAFTAICVYVFWRHEPPDIVSPYLAGWFFNDQIHELYSYSIVDIFVQNVPPNWVSIAADKQYVDGDIFPYLYPPYIAGLLAPLTKVLSIPEFTLFFFLVQLPLMYYSVMLSWKIAGRPTKLIFWQLIGLATIFTSSGGLLAIAQNQFQITIAFFILFAFERYQRGKFKIAGVLFAIAGGIKIAPMLFGLLLLAKKRLLGAAYMAITGLLMLGLSIMWAGLETHLLYFDQISEVGNNVFISRQNWSLYSFLYEASIQLSGNTLGPSADINLVATAPAWIKLTNTLGLAIGIIWITYSFARSTKLHQQVALFLLFNCLLGLSSPLGWSHNYLPLLYFAPVLFSWFKLRVAALLYFAVFGPQLLLFDVNLALMKADIDWSSIAGTSGVFAGIIVFIWVSTRDELGK